MSEIGFTESNIDTSYNSLNLLNLEKKNRSLSEMLTGKTEEVVQAAIVCTY